MGMFSTPYIVKVDVLYIYYFKFHMFYIHTFHVGMFYKHTIQHYSSGEFNLHLFNHNYY